jgi:hypothetical protein
MPLLDDKDLIQVDATAVAGVLILLTLTTITSDFTEIKIAYTTLIGSFIVAAIVPFSLSVFFIILGNFYILKPPKDYLRRAAFATLLGFIYLVIVVVIVIVFSFLSVYFGK